MTGILIDWPTYLQDRCREAWCHHRTSEASRLFLRRHAVVWSRPVVRLAMAAE